MIIKVTIVKPRREIPVLMKMKLRTESRLFRTAADEACDFLLNQRSEAERLQMVCRLDSDVMETVFTALWSGEDRASAEADQDMAQAILETLIPQVTFETDDRGVKCIRLGLPVKES